MRGWVLLGLAIGCGSGEDTDVGGLVGDCAGAHVGAFDGSQSGELTGDLAADGTLSLAFDSAIGPLTAEATIAEDGTITAEQEGVVVEGTYDLDACSGAGTWDYAALGASGTWTLARE